ncbi:MAG: fibro-slime domain-containing protein [Deltaproteobacteria bacterium]|nr:fibro-slime domain-containing protein [Deltaproteobacteria bacterium]
MGRFLFGSVMALALTISFAARSQSTVKPRILILFDTSGSMTFDIGGSPTFGDGSRDIYADRYCCPGLGESRMRIAKDAITQMIDSTGDIEFALMKFPQAYDADGNPGFQVQWYVNNQSQGANDSLRYQGLGAGDTDEVTVGTDVYYDYAPYFISDSDSSFNQAFYLCEEFPDADDLYYEKIEELKAWFDHVEYDSDTSMDIDSNVFVAPLTSVYPSPYSELTEQELRGDGGTPLGEAVHAAYRYLAQVKAADPVSECRPYYLVILADGDFDGRLDPITGADVVGGTGDNAGFEFEYGVDALHDVLQVETWVIGLAAQSTTLDYMADVGGCHYDPARGAAARTAHPDSNCNGSIGYAFLANSQQSLSTILANIISSAILIEECNYLDDDCDGLVDEGVAGDYCDPNKLSLPATVFWDTDSDSDSDTTVYPYWYDTDGELYRNPNWNAVCDDPGELVCDGLDDNCNGQVDEVPIDGWSITYNPDWHAQCVSQGAGYTTTIPSNYNTTGVQCKSGLVQCIPGNGLACIGAVGPTEETCDGMDNDCDGDTDEDTAGNPLENTGATCGKDVGICSAGHLVCVDGDWQCNAVWGTDETCDGSDNDCDGQADETFPNKGNACYSDTDAIADNGCMDTNSDGTYDCKGICEPGQLTCLSGSEVCVGMVTPRSEDNTCNGLDDDCDGLLDEDVVETQVCPAGAASWTTFQMEPYSICNAGTMQCNSSIPAMQCVGNDGTDVVSPRAEICDGLDNNCEGTVDETTAQSCGGCEIGVDTEFDCISTDPGAGRCTVGTRTCQAVLGSGVADWSSCVGDVGPTAEMCNNLDDDCDGIVDEGISLGPCYPAGLIGCVGGVCKGECQEGTYTCTSGTISCAGYVKPVSEGSACDNLDNNCNGDVDEGITNDCGDDIDTDSWPDAAYGVGICRKGTQYCSPDTESEDPATWGACSGAQGPQKELCNGLDDDCDGKFEDEESVDLLDNQAVSLVGTPCGACNGVYQCLPNSARTPGQIGAYELVCVGDEPADEVCNGADDNCNDVIDDGIDPVPCGGCVTGLDTDSPCVPGNPSAGECVEGLNICFDGAMTTACFGSVGPVAEVCDGRDNDCDGQSDEDFDNMEDVVCQVAVGECPQGIQQCVSVVDGEIVETSLHCCDAEVWDSDSECTSPVVAQMEVCDGRDNDCDDSVDEDIAGSGEACGQSLGICEPGLMQCVQDPVTKDYAMVCVGGSGGTSEECNCLDDDCDGQVDEDVLPYGQCSKAPNWMSDEAVKAANPEGIGECTVGQFECKDCGWECSAPGPTDEVCDGLDNDCDGLVDEDDEVECPLAGAICLEGECAEPCNEGEFVCPVGKSCITYEAGVRICMATVCDAGNDLALPCVFNEYYCTPGEGFEPPCACDPLAQKCVDVCYNKDCGKDRVCVVADNGRCHDIAEGCMVTGCESGYKCVPIALCTDGICAECVVDPCAGVTCAENQYCNSDGQCVGTCVDVTCPALQGCVEGVCVADSCAGVMCKTGVVCNPQTGLCDVTLTNPCAGISCDFYERCEEGNCVPDECVNIECPNGTVCFEGSCYLPEGQTSSGTDTDTTGGDTAGGTDSADTSGMGGDSATDSASDSEEPLTYEGLTDVLATGMGGCLCSAAPGASSENSLPWMVIVFGAMLALLRLARRRRAEVYRLWLTRIILLGLVVLALGCQVEPFHLGEEDTGSGSGTGGGTTSSDSAGGTDSSGINPTDGGGSDSDDTSSYGTDGGGTDSTDGGTDSTDFDSSNDTGVDCSTCAVGETCCSRENGAQYCVNLLTSPSNCGTCGMGCTVAHASAGCVQGQCAVAACDIYWYDQNGNIADGCEHFCQPTVDPDDNADRCDGFATSADPDNDSYVPVDNDCDFSFDEDVDFQNDDKNCGYCGHLCLFNHGSPDCVNGQCTLSGCDSRWWNLNDVDTDGCEYYCDGDTAAIETCDNLDNNCNGQKDEGNPEGGAPCYPIGSTGCIENTDGTYSCQGICQAGIISCVSGNLECSGYQLPQTEVCDGLDNNCNGVPDEALRIPCGGAPGANPNEGICQTGLASCVAQALASGVAGPEEYDTDDGCVGAVGPAMELCDGLDNDCDGLTDELSAADSNANNIEIHDGVRLGVACGLGICAANVTQCIDGTITCLDDTDTHVEIACDSADNDCDGAVDEVETYQCGGSSTVPCNRPANDCDPYNEGICQVGTYSCADSDGCVGDVGPSCGDTDHCDVCDGEDNDCDGLVDEDAFHGFVDSDTVCGSPCNDGHLECIGGAMTCVDANLNYGPDVCDGIDNDCDASTPDGAGDTSYEIACDGTDDADKCELGVMRCDGTHMYCDENPALNRVEVCDGDDNDCDGDTDELSDLTVPDIGAFGCYECPAATVTQVVCDGTSGWRCEYDVTNTGIVECDRANDSDPCFALVIQETRCDSEDNDCDGVVDDAFNFSNDVTHCGDCNTDCTTIGAPNVNSYRCSGGVCEIATCKGNYRDANLTLSPTDGCECEYNVAACGTDPDNPMADCDVCWGDAGYGDDNCDNVANDAAETVERQCDGIDNDCDSDWDLDDADLNANDAPGVCAAKCVAVGQATVTCVGDTSDTEEDWACVYDANVELDINGVPVVNETLCDGLDNDCDGFIDESLATAPYLGAACDNSDDSDTNSQGACILTGIWRCDTDAAAVAVCCQDTDSDAVCANVVLTPSEVAQGKIETPNGLDDDCDGLVDENTNCVDSDAYVSIDYDSNGTDDYDIFAFEASRQGASSGSAGSGSNGVACAKDGVLPWTGITRADAETACQQLAYADTDSASDQWHLCSASQWQFACEMGGIAQTDYPYGDTYDPNTCNGVEYTTIDGMMPVGDMPNCIAEWGTTDLYDMSGNVEEWTSTETTLGSGTYQIRGGSWNDQAGSMKCNFDLWAANGATFKMDNLGFRCCRGADPNDACDTVDCIGDTNWECDTADMDVLLKFDGKATCYAGTCLHSYNEVFCVNGCDTSARGLGLAGCVDQDGDGYVAIGFEGSLPAELDTGDCNDLDPTSHPGQCEIYSEDGRDNDCDSEVDEVELTATIRDIERGTHVDFPYSTITSCEGLILDTLSTDRKPQVNTGATTCTAMSKNGTTFSQWYNTDTDTTSPVNLEKQICMPLTGPDLDGNYQAGAVEDGEMFFNYGTGCTQLQYYPIRPGELFNDLQTTNPCGTTYSSNYYFTTEMHFMFRYESGQKFEFSGDDDLWVFIDGNLAIDLGGIHGAQNASVTMTGTGAGMIAARDGNDADTDPNYTEYWGLVEDQSYRMDIFGAERNITHSNFLITTSIAGIEAAPQ